MSRAAGLLESLSSFSYKEDCCLLRYVEEQSDEDEECYRKTHEWHVGATIARISGEPRTSNVWRSVEEGKANSTSPLNENIKKFFMFVQIFCCQFDRWWNKKSSAHRQQARNFDFKKKTLLFFSIRCDASLLLPQRISGSLQLSRSHLYSICDLNHQHGMFFGDWMRWLLRCTFSLMNVVLFQDRAWNPICNGDLEQLT